MAGRELDAEVSIHVFGRGPVANTKENGNQRLKDKEGLAIPYYSTDRSDALKVIGKIHDDGGWVQETFFNRYDGFDLKPIKQGQSIEHVRIDAKEICGIALDVYKKFNERKDK